MFRLVYYMEFNIRNIAKRKLFWNLFLIVFLFINFFIATGLAVAYFKGWDKWQIIAKIPETPRKIGESFLRFVIDLPYLKYRFQENKLPVYELSIADEDLRALNAALPDPKSQDYVNYITDANKIKRPAKLFFDGEEYDVDVRYHGLMSRHWLWRKKSMRFILKDSVDINGAKKLDFITAYGREYALDHFNNFRAKKLGLIVPDSEFVWLKVNGVDHGVYYKIDSWDENFLKKNGLDPNSNMYGERIARIPIYEPFSKSFTEWDKKTINKNKLDNDYGDLSSFLEILNSSDRDFYRDIWKIVDRDNFLKWFLHSELAGSQSQDRSHNIRIYFDKIKQKFIFFPIDVNNGEINEQFLFSQYNPLVNRVLSDHDFLLDFEKMLWNYVKDGDNLTEDLAKYDEIANLIRVPLYQDRFDEENSGFVDAVIADHRRILENNIYKIKNLLQQAEIGGLNYIHKDGKNLFFTLDTRVKSNAIINLENFSIEGLPSAGYPLSIFEDQNNNGIFDPSDMLVGTLVYDNDKGVYLSLTDINSIFYPNFVVPSDDNIDVLDYPPITLDNAEKRFFIRTSLPGSTTLDNLKIQLVFENMITGDAFKFSSETFVDSR